MAGGTLASAALAAVAATRPASRATVRMVPSVGLLTARYAALAASSNAPASSAGVSELLPSTARAKPRKICERMTPELPRAPMRLPCDASLAILLTSAACDSFTSSTADCTVSSILVPVLAAQELGEAAAQAAPGHAADAVAAHRRVAGDRGDGGRKHLDAAPLAGLDEGGCGSGGHSKAHGTIHVRTQASVRCCALISSRKVP